jgi:hypothetical protein
MQLTSTADLRALLHRGMLVVDLRHGPARANAVAHDLAAQLPEAATADGPTRARIGAAFGFAAAAARGIDAESAGDSAYARGVMLSQALAGAVRRTGKHDILLLRADDGRVMHADEAMVRALVDRLHGTDVRFIDALARPATHTHTVWPGRLVPGLISPELLRVLAPSPCDEAKLVELQHGQRLLPIEWVPARPPATRLDYDRLAALPQIPDWLRAHAQMHGNNHFVDTDLLVRQAWLEFEAGGKELAYELLTRAQQVTREPFRQAVIQCHLQGMRIADLRYGLAASEPPPHAHLPAELRSFLLLAKGWGCVLDGRAAEGEQLLEQAQDLAGYAPHSAEQLYINNIRALARFRQGDVATAFAIEENIENVLSGLSGNAQLTCVNALNLARLHAARGEHALASGQYQRAFDTSRGVWTDSDLVYARVCQARCLEAAGQSSNAKLEWLRAALCWLSSPGRLGMSPRIAAIIGGHPWVDPESAAKGVTDTLTRALLSHSHRKAPISTLRVIRVHEAISADAASTLYHANGITVLTGESISSVARLAPPDASIQQLAVAATTALGECLGARIGASDAALGLPMRPGYGVPSTPLEALAEALRLGAARACISGRLVGPPRPEQALWWVRPNPAIETLEGDSYWLKVSFRRHRVPCWVRGVDAELLLHARQEPAVQALAHRLNQSAPECLKRLQRLEALGMVECFLKEMP